MTYISPQLIDNETLQHLINNNTKINNMTNPSTIDIIFIKIKDTLYTFAINNIIISIILLIIIGFLFYRFITYKLFRANETYKNLSITEINEEIKKFNISKHKQYNKKKKITNNKYIPKTINKKEHIDPNKTLPNPNQQTAPNNLYLINSSSYEPSNLMNTNNYHGLNW